jgi:hypothetical protein
VSSAAGLSRSGFYAWQQRPAARRTLQDPKPGVGDRRDLRGESRPLRQPAVHAELRVRGQQTARKRVARLMRIASLRARDAFAAPPTPTTE